MKGASTKVLERRKMKISIGDYEVEGAHIIAEDIYNSLSELGIYD